MKVIFTAALFASSALAAPVQAQSAPSAGDIAVLREQIVALQAQVAALEQQVSKAIPAPVTVSNPTPVPASTTATTWKGAPQFEDKASGFSFKPKGFVQFDSGYIDNPNDAITGGALGYRTRLRRVVFGAEGSLPGGFGYKAEFNFANGSVEYEDIILTWQPKGKPVMVTIGNAYPLTGLDTMTSSRLGSVLERSAANDAFNFGRRLGISLGINDPKDIYTLNAGLYQGPISNGFTDNQWQASVRGTFAPKIGKNARLHIGANFQYREYATSLGQAQTRYRARPYTQLTDVRFVDSGLLNVSSDTVLGLEFAGIFGPLHFASEGHKLWVKDFSPAVGQSVDDDPSFFSGYVEAGLYLTGDTRVYKGGKWDRVKVKNPITQGGIGAVQINARLDYLDLTDRTIVTQTATPFLINGGKQTGYQLSLIWNPVDYLRFLIQYSHSDVEGGPRAATVVPGSAKPVDQRTYGTDSVAVRAQVEF